MGPAVDNAERARACKPCAAGNAIESFAECGWSPPDGGRMEAGADSAAAPAVTSSAADLSAGTCLGAGHLEPERFGSRAQTCVAGDEHEVVGLDEFRCG